MRCARSWRTARRTIQPMSGLWCDAEAVALGEAADDLVPLVERHLDRLAAPLDQLLLLLRRHADRDHPDAQLADREHLVAVRVLVLEEPRIEPSESAPFDSFTLYSETLTIDVASVTIEHTSADMYACVMSVHTPMRGTCSPGVADARDEEV